MARGVGRLSVGERRYGAPQLRVDERNSSSCAVQTSPLGQVKPPQARSQGAATAHKHAVSCVEDSKSTLNG